MATTPEMDEANVSKEDFVEIIARRSFSRTREAGIPMSVLSRFQTLGPPPREERETHRARERTEV
jgi:hypothetical protein